MRRIVRWRSTASREVGLNIPACQAFFRCLETSGDTITDAKNGISWTCPGNTLLSTDPLLFDAAGSVGTVQPVMGANQAGGLLRSGSWPLLSTQSIVMVCAARINVLDGLSFRLTIGDQDLLIPGSNGQGFGMSDGPFHATCGQSGVGVRVIDAGVLLPDTFAWVSNGARIVFSSIPTVSIFPVSGPSGSPGSGAVATATLSGGTTGTATVNFSSYGAGYEYGIQISLTDGTNTAYATMEATYYSLDSTYQGQDVLVYATYIPNVGMNYRAVQLADPGSGTVLLNTVYQTSASNNAGTFQPWPDMRTANAAFYGIAFFAFESGFPPNILGAILNMGGMWRAGNRYLDSSLIGAT